MQNLLKKHQLVERDVSAREDRLGELSGQARKFVLEQHFDADNIQEKHRNISDRYSRYAKTAQESFESSVKLWWIGDNNVAC